MAGQASRINGRKGGRPHGRVSRATIDKAVHREVLRALVVAELKPMTEAQIAAAKGIQHFVLRTKAGKFERVTSEEAALAALNDPEAVYEFWTRDPSIQAYADLMNRALDKPTEQVAVTGPEGGPLEIIVKAPWRNAK